MLYRSTDRLSRGGAPMKNLAHSASFQSPDKDAPSKPRTEQLEPTRAVAASVCRSRRMRRSSRALHDRQFGGEGASFGQRRPKRGPQDQAIGRSRGGRTTKIHALVDEEGRPRAFLLTGGNIADIKGAEPLLASME